MTLQRGDSLPPGRYWLDAFGPAVAIAAAWFAAQTPIGNARVLKTEGSAGSEGTWFLFEVPAGHKLPWPELELGSPTIATPDVQSRQDTVQRPPPEPDVLDQINPGAVVETAGLLVGAIAAAATLWVAFEMFSARKLARR